MASSAPESKTPDPQQRAATLAVILTTLAWALPPILVKQSTLPSLTFAAYRLWIGVAIYAIIFAVTRRRLRWSTIKACAVGGLIFAVDIALAFAAFRLTSVANATIIASLSTITIIIGAARWFGERLVRTDIWFVVASMVGVVLVAVGSAGLPSFSLVGDGLALIGVFSWTAYWLYSKRAREQIPALEYMATIMLVAAVALTIVAPVVDGGFAPPTSQDWVQLITVAFLAGTIGHSLLAWSHQHLASWVSALILQTQPLFAALAASLILQEEIGWVTAIGGAIVLLAAGALVIRTAKRDPDELASEDSPVPAP